MRPHRARTAQPLAALLFVLALSTSTRADQYKIEPLKDAPPAEIAAPIRATLDTQGYRILDGQGKPYAEIWLRKGVPASEKPAGPKGPILYPFLAEGEILGALRYPDQGSDNRDQAIPKGVYTIRYGLQPVNGDHLGVSVYRDYMLLLPAGKDTALAPLARKPLEERSSEAAGSSHPAILMLVPATDGAKAPAMVHNEEKDAWGAIVPLSVQVKGGSGTTTQNVQIMVVGVFGG